MTGGLMEINANNPVEVLNSGGASSVVLVCEHASFHIPDSFNHLGLLPEHRKSHAAWDPGAMAVARGISSALDAAIVAATTSRLVYDCNRPPDALDAMPVQSEIVRVPGNANLSPQARAARHDTYYKPFRDALAGQIRQTENPVVVSIHSFTPVYLGVPRMVEIGVLHDADRRLADALIHSAPNHTARLVERNKPYGPEDGVTHTLQEHGVKGDHLNVMLEIRNDLIQTPAKQHQMAEMMARWLQDAFAQTGTQGVVQCGG